MATDTGEEIIIPGLETIPVLPEDHPLFDWADWPTSRAALQSGMATSRFQKDAWNAIIDALGNALELAGIGWQEPYKIEDSKMLTPYGRLQARDVNIVRSHVDLITDFPWPWEADPNFRGYLGTKWFKGTTIAYDENGAISQIFPGDEVYPEYILELVRRINLLIELMRGTASTVESEALHRALSQIYSKGAVSGMSAGMGQIHFAFTKIGQLKLEGFAGTGFSASYRIKSLQAARMERVPGAGIFSRLLFNSLIALSGRAARNEQVIRGSAKLLAGSAARVDAGFSDPSYMDLEAVSKARSVVQPAQLPPRSTKGQQNSFSLAAVSADARNDLKVTSAQQQSATSLQMDIMSIIPRFVVTEHRAKTMQQLEILLTKMIEVLMHTDLSIQIEGCVSAEDVLDVQMELAWNFERLLGQGSVENPADWTLCLDPCMWGNAGAETGLFNPRLAFLIDDSVWRANCEWMYPSARLLEVIRTDAFNASARKQFPEAVSGHGWTNLPWTARVWRDAPRDLFAYVRTGFPWMARPRREAPRALQGDGWANLPWTAHVWQDTPRDLFAYIGTGFPWVGCPRWDVPRKVLGHGWTNLPWTARVWLDAPKDLFAYVGSNFPWMARPRREAPRALQGDGWANLPWTARVWRDTPRDLSAYVGTGFPWIGCPRRDVPGVFLLWAANDFVSCTGQPRAQEPNGCILWASDIQYISCFAKQLMPQELLLWAGNNPCNVAASVEQSPTDRRLLSISDVFSSLFPVLQVPNVWMLEAQDQMLSVTDPELALPWVYRAWGVVIGNIFTSANLQNPDAVQLAGIADLTALANWALLLRRSTRGIAEFWNQSFLTADLMTPVPVRMLFGMQMMTIAHAGILNRKAVQASGYLAETIGGSLTVELSEAVAHLMATSAGLYARAGSNIADVTSGGGKLQMEVDADMGGYTIRIVATRGGIAIEFPDIYAAADTAIALQSAGRQIELQIDVRLGGISARYAAVRMWAAVPLPDILAGGMKEAVRSITAVISIEDVDILVQGRLADTARSGGCTEFSLGVTGGGSVRTADGLWANPVQVGSNLYIAHVQQSWNDRKKLYIDLDVFYEPVQTGSDLYIRSADTVWTDGNSANIDTAFFLEPVQEETNLHIRQDIFGGE